MFQVGSRVVTEYGAGVVRESSHRRVFIVLDDGETLNVSTGTPGYDRIRSTRSIERVLCGSLEEGQFICAVDDDELLDPNQRYSAEDQEWVCVVRLRGHADVGTIVTQDDDCERRSTPCSWDQWTWRLLGEDGKPVVDYALAGA